VVWQGWCCCWAWGCRGVVIIIVITQIYWFLNILLCVLLLGWGCCLGQLRAAALVGAL
jgi:hypothetical protein